MPTTGDEELFWCILREFKRPYELPTELSYREQVIWLQEQMAMQQQAYETVHQALVDTDLELSRVPRWVRRLFGVRA